MAVTTYLRNKLADHALGTAEYTFPSQVYVGLILQAGPPNIAGGGTEVSTSGTNYGRIAIDFSAASNGVALSSTDALFACSGTGFGTVAYYAIYDAVSAGNMLCYSGLTSPQDIGDEDSYLLESGDIRITVL